MNPDFLKYSDGLIPAIIQDNITKKVLMLGFMNEEAYTQTKETGNVTFFSRSKQRLWMKGESSNNYLVVKEIKMDCDNDTFLILAEPSGPVCHTGADTCFQEDNFSFSLEILEQVIANRKKKFTEDSYISLLFSKGLNKIAQKVGEEAVELIIEAKDNDDEKFLNEAADLLFHYLVLLQAKGHGLNDVKKVLAARHKNR